ncbi:hypothetical protein [Kineosporia babensis]|uniref:Immunity protein 35 domain-containing protein n=1 Tax=Kineosporia babensis TaxID=499548 RepID=A0A9X1NML6_9ACTN|nr:hypothetical protein [Kineosporia babensis]MCD5316943.1 hypothetical protein [Kineosporia babensis]
MDAYELAAKLPPIEVLRDRCRALAVLDRTLAGEDAYHYYVPVWGEGQAAIHQNGGGDEWAVIFTPDGCFIRVFDHESKMTPYRDSDMDLWPGLFDGLPEAFRDQLEEPAFSDDGDYVATALLWRGFGDPQWATGRNIVFPEVEGTVAKSPDGTEMLEILLDDMADRYPDFAEDIYEMVVTADDVTRVIARQPLTDELLLALNPEADLDDVRGYAAEIGYPA